MVFRRARPELRAGIDLAFCSCAVQPKIEYWLTDLAVCSLYVIALLCPGAAEGSSLQWTCRDFNNVNLNYHKLFEDLILLSRVLVITLKFQGSIFDNRIINNRIIVPNSKLSAVAQWTIIQHLRYSLTLVSLLAKLLLFMAEICCISFSGVWDCE